MTGGIRFFRFAGIDVYLDWSLIIIFLLITLGLGLMVFPTWLPDLGQAAALGMGAVAAVLFLLSVLVHEFSHALVGRAKGMTVRRITLFVFGGMAHLESDAPNWKVEFWMTIVGPVTSFMLGAGFLLLSGLFISPEAAEATDPEQAMQLAGPVASLFFWLGAVNVLLAIFNLVPGFPLDGGRVLRALIWGATGSFEQATRWASRAGQLFAGLLIGIGILMMLGIPVPPFGAGLIPGLWLAFIGWFLNNAAVMSYRQTKMRRALADMPVSRLVRREVTRVPASISVQQLVDQYVLAAGDQRAWPVERNGRLVGLITLNDVRALGREARAGKTVEQAMTPWDKLQTTSPDEDASQAFEQLASRGVNQLPVLERGELVGMLRRDDLMRWLSWSGRRGD